MEDSFSTDGQRGGEEWFQDDSSALRLGFMLLWESNTAADLSWSSGGGVSDGELL